ncbi:hypothetical protein V8F20_004393 [Naviculisporaceae sp. PSN 640]
MDLSESGPDTKRAKAPGQDVLPPAVLRTGTSKVGIVPSRRQTPRLGPDARKEHDEVSPAIKELYPNDPSITTDMDIVFVPGMGADPEDSGKSQTTGFNWVSNKEGLARDFPRARILVYTYESVWMGNLRAKRHIENQALNLLYGLQSIRPEPHKTSCRPIVFVGHSMGGLVIAKATCLAAGSRQHSFPRLFDHIAGCIFFGTPFGGVPAAEFASMVASLGGNFDTTVTSRLLELMQPDSEFLNELRNGFVRCVGKLSQRIRLYAFFEEQETDLDLCRVVTPKNLKGVLVNKDSATLSGIIDSMGMAANHSELCKFESSKDRRYQAVRERFKMIIHGAHLVVKNRLNSTRDIDREMVKSLMNVLGGAQVAKKRKMISQSVVPSDWITKEPEYVQWLARLTDLLVNDSQQETGVCECLWLYGSWERDKTSAAIAALDDIENMIRMQNMKCSGEAPIILAYFFCDTTPGYCTAEDLLKSFIRQLIDRHEILAKHAKQFLRKKAKNDSRPKRPMTVENMWQTLQDMLRDEDIGFRVYFVINNLHALPKHAASTKSLMALFRSSLTDQDPTRHVPVRWLIASRATDAIKDAVSVPGTRSIDLEADKYSNQVSLANRHHARSKVRKLAEKNKYSKALAYFASSLIGAKAQNTEWVDIVCIRLEELQTNNDLQVRRELEGMPQDLQGLLDHVWSQIFAREHEYLDRLREVLRVMLLTLDDPTLEELEVLAGFDGLQEEQDEQFDLVQLIDKCKPFIVLETKGKVKCNSKVGFMSSAVKNHLLGGAEALIGLTVEKTQWQHGVLALRSFAHIMECCRSGKEECSRIDEPIVEEEYPSQDLEHEAQDDNRYDSSDWDSVEDPDDSSEDEFESKEVPQHNKQPPLATKPLKPHPYMIKHWLHHASKATVEIAEELSLESEFWEAGSPIRRQWLKEYTGQTNAFLKDLKGFDLGSMSALHVASSFSYKELVGSLMRNGHRDEITVRVATSSTPLHFAAWFGWPDIVEVLLNNGAPIDDGIESNDLTPLHMAACKGHVEVIERLLKSKADPNATCSNFGPVINGAIMSGSRRAVELLVDAKAELLVESDEFESPLAAATLLPDKSMFDYLLKSCSGEVPDRVYEKAMIRAAEEGKVDIFEQLISDSTIIYTDEGYRKAREVAERESRWDIIRILLLNHEGLDCVDLFVKAATGLGCQDQILAQIWQYTQQSIPQEVLDRCLYRAVNVGKESTVQLLLGFNADPNAAGQEYGNALTAAAFNGPTNIVKNLIAAGADVNSPNGWPLHAAAACGHLAVVAELLAGGAEVNRVITKGHVHDGTALHSACGAGKREVVDLLLKHRADPNLGRTNGTGSVSTCPLIVASRKGEYEIFKSLIQAGATVDVFGGPAQTTPLINATASLPKEALELLLEHGANINLSDKTVCDTALIIASREGDSELVSYLLEQGADILHSNRRGENALQAALLSRNEMCLGVLVDHVSRVMACLKTAIDTGNKAVANVVKSPEKEVKTGVTVGVKKQVEEKAKENTPQITTSEEIKGSHPTEISVISDNDDSSKIVIIPDNDDSSKIEANIDDDMPAYMVETFADVDDFGIPIALPSLGLPQSFSVSSPPPPAASPPPPPPRPASPATTVTSTQPEDVTTAPNLTYRPPHDIRCWTPDSEPLDGKGAPRSRSASPVITILTRRKPTPGARKNTATNTVSSADQERKVSESTDQNSSVSHTPNTSLEQNVPIRVQLTDTTVPTQSHPPLSDSPQPLQSPFASPAASRSPSPPKQEAPQQQAPAPRRDTVTAVKQPPAYAALVAANFRSQSQPQHGTHPLVRPSQSSGGLHQPGHSSSPSYSLRSLFSIPPASSSVIISPLTSPAPTTASLVSHGSSASITTLASNPVQHQQIQQQQNVYKQKSDVYPSLHDRLEEKAHSPIPHQKSLPSLSSPGWTMQVGDETAEQPVTVPDMGTRGQRIGAGPGAKRMSVSVVQEQIPLQLQSPPQEKTTSAASLAVAPKIASPPASYDGEGWGDSPV